MVEGMPRNRRSGLLLLLGVSLLVLGLSFCLLLWRGYLAAKTYDLWVETPATVLASWIETESQPGGEPDRYAFRVRYRFLWQGEPFVSTRYTDLAKNSRHRRRIERRQANYAVGKNTVCFVNPDDPREALLKKPTKAPGYTLWFPGLFAVAGLGMCLVAIRRRHR